MHPQIVPDYTTNLLPIDGLGSKPLAGVRFGIITKTVGDGVDKNVLSAVRQAAVHLESLGASVREVAMPNFSLGLLAYYALATSEASSNLARYDGVRYGPRAHGEEGMSMYSNSRAQGFGPEVKRRILMGTYAFSAGYYDAVYKKAQQVRTVMFYITGKWVLKRCFSGSLTNSVGQKPSYNNLLQMTESLG